MHVCINLDRTMNFDPTRPVKPWHGPTRFSSASYFVAILSGFFGIPVCKMPESSGFDIIDKIASFYILFLSCLNQWQILSQ